MRGSLERVPLWGGIVRDQEQYLDFSSDFLDRTMGNIVGRVGEFGATRYQELSSALSLSLPRLLVSLASSSVFSKIYTHYFFARFNSRSVSSSKWNQSVFISHSISSHFRNTTFSPIFNSFAQLSRTHCCLSFSLSLSLSLLFFFVVLLPCWKFPFQFFKLAPALRAVITTRFRRGMGNENSRGETKKKKKEKRWNCRSAYWKLE